MYCKKCGKFICTDDDYCSDCVPKQAPEAVPVVEPTHVAEPIAEPIYTPCEPAKPQRQGRVMDGFGAALTSTILGIYSFSFGYVAYLFMTLNGVMGSIFGGDEVSGIAIKAVCAIYILIAVGLGIPALVMGIKSIKLFRSAVKNKRVKPIPALILGIYGTVMSGSGLLVSVGAFMVLLSSLMLL